jgi:hypothetical protein
MNAPAFEVADIIRLSGDEFIRQHNPLGYHKGVLTALRQCRTEALGCHIYQCSDCGHTHIAYHSCRNRHCPKCRQVAKERWIMAREAELLPVGYLHMVFTLPDVLNPLCLKYPAMMYNLLFHAVRDTMFIFAADPKHLGADIGYVAVLHTWGQTLTLHPHLHIIIPAGGYNIMGDWVNARGKGDYLFPVKALSPVFRAKFRDGLKIALADAGIEKPPGLFEQMMLRKWVVYAKEPFGSPNQVVEYLGRYSHRIAISNHRIVNVTDHETTFRYKDYGQAGVQKQMTLSNLEFLRRFCMHILPHGFMKIRHYGFLSSRRKGEYIIKPKDENGKAIPMQKPTWQQVCRERLGFDPEKCPCCGSPNMKIVGIVEPRPPPENIINAWYEILVKIA